MPIRQPVLNNSSQAARNSDGDQAGTDSSAVQVKGAIFGVENLHTHDASKVTKHDIQSHCDIAFLSRPTVEGNPRAVDRICT